MDLKRRVRVVAFAILLAGLCVGMLIFRFVPEVEDASLGYTIAGNTISAFSLRETKRYRHDLEQFGGKAALMFDDFSNWFAGLWQGKALGKTIMWIGGLVSVALLLFAYYLPDPPLHPAASGEPEKIDRSG